MADQEIRSELDMLEKKLYKLLQAYSQLKAERDLLKNENAELRSKLEIKDNHLNDFQNKIKISKIVNKIHGEGDNIPELRNMLDNYIRQIDKCILHLSK